MNKLIKHVAPIFLVLTWMTASAQTYKDEMQSLGAQNLKWFTDNTPNLLKKTPYNIKDVTQEQLADTTKATPQEVIEIQKAAQQREAYQAKFTQIVNKYINPPEAAKELLQSSNNSKNKLDDAAKRLASGSITYGQYNLLKQQIVAENMANSKKVVEKYDLFKSPTSHPQAPQQAPPTHTSAPIAQKLQGPVQLIDTQNRISSVGSCFAVLQRFHLIHKDSVGGIENWMQLKKKADLLLPSFKQDRNPAPQGMNPHSWGNGYGFTAPIFEKATDADRLRAMNVCFSVR